MQRLPAIRVGECPRLCISDKTLLWCVRILVTREAQPLGG